MKTDPCTITNQIVYVRDYECSDSQGFVVTFDNTVLHKLSRSRDMNYMFGYDIGDPVHVNVFLFHSPKTDRYWVQRDVFTDITGEMVHESRIEFCSTEQAMMHFTEASTQYVPFHEAFPGIVIAEA